MFFSLRTIAYQSENAYAIIANNCVIFQAEKHDIHRLRMKSTNTVAMRSKSWRPSLQSISEAAS